MVCCSPVEDTQVFLKLYCEMINWSFKAKKKKYIEAHFSILSDGKCHLFYVKSCAIRKVKLEKNDVQVFVMAGVERLYNINFNEK